VLQMISLFAILLAAGLALVCDYRRYEQLKAALSEKRTGTCARCSHLSREPLPLQQRRQRSNAPYAALSAPTPAR
jgi:hypothetical protein